jgi:hypothetical protein
MQPGTGGRGNGRLGDPGVVGDPRHDRGRVSALGEDHSTLDHLTTRGVRTRQTYHQLTNRIVVHTAHTSLSAHTAPARMDFPLSPCRSPISPPGARRFHRRSRLSPTQRPCCSPRSRAEKKSHRVHVRERERRPWDPPRASASPPPPRLGAPPAQPPEALPKTAGRARDRPRETRSGTARRAAAAAQSAR